MDYVSHYNRFSPSYNLYSLNQPGALYCQQGPCTPPWAGSAMAAVVSEHSDYAIVDSIGVKIIIPDKKAFYVEKSEH